jgi:methionyl aminopeptidase
MIRLKTAEDIVLMREAGRILARVLQELSTSVRAGLRTKDLDDQAETALTRAGVRPAFKGYRGYPSALCVSINEEVVHGIPSNRRIREGDIVSLDLGAELEGCFADAATSVAVGRVLPRARQLLEVGKSALAAGIAKAQAGLHLGDISAAIQQEIERNGFSVVRDFVGHGIGRQLHEELQIPNYGESGTGVLLQEGMTLAIEPMANMGSFQVAIKNDGWTVVTQDKCPSVHFEHTILVTGHRPEILTEWS